MEGKSNGRVPKPQQAKKNNKTKTFSAGFLFFFDGVLLQEDGTEELSYLNRFNIYFIKKKEWKV